MALKVVCMMPEESYNSADGRIHCLRNPPKALAVVFY